MNDIEEDEYYGEPPLCIPLFIEQALQALNRMENQACELMAPGTRRRMRIVQSIRALKTELRELGSNR